nr:hypothetical protein GCM10023233_17360 [Brevibacterium otitidis]
MSSLLAVVDDLHIARARRGPDEADAPLVVDLDAVLPRPVALQEFDPVAGRNPKLVELVRRVEKQQLHERLPLHTRVEPLDPLAQVQRLAIPICEGDDHDTTV